MTKPTQVSNYLMGHENPKSKWNKGVLEYAFSLIIDVAENTKNKDLTREERRKEILNGADNRKQYSRWWMALIYNQDIAYKLCTPSELKKTKNWLLKPNKQEERLDTQARALYQAEQLIARAIDKIERE